MISKNKKIVVAILTALFIFNTIAWLAFFDLRRAGALEVIFFDIGQGDAILIKSPQGHYILIDGGPGSAILEKLSKQIPFWQRKIDLVILTHSHYDHYGGLIDVVKSHNIENILWNGATEESAAFAKWNDLISSLETTNIVIAWAGQRIKGDDFFIDVLYPFVNLEGEVFKDPNLSSLVLRLVFGESVFLFTGDAYKSMEKELIEKENFCQEQENYQPICLVMTLDSDVLKVGHHGSKSSTDQEFLEKVLPEIAVISAGRDNRFGHPHQETLETLEKYGIKIFRTDIDGDIKIFSDGKNIKISNY